MRNYGPVHCKWNTCVYSPFPPGVKSGPAFMETAATVSAADFKKLAESWVSDGALKICWKIVVVEQLIFLFLGFKHLK